MKNLLDKISPTKQIYIIYNAINIFVAIIFYYLIPRLLNYPPDSMGKMEIEIIGFTYTQQYLIISSIIVLMGVIFINRITSKINLTKLKEDENLADRLRQEYFLLPYKIYITQVIIPIITFFIIFLFLKANTIITLKISILLLTAATTASIISYIFSKRILKKVLIKLKHSSKKDSKYLRGKFKFLKFGLRGSIFFQIIPMFVIAILFTGLMGYSRLIREKGGMLFDIYKNELENRVAQETINSEEEIDIIKSKLEKIKLKSENDFWFIYTPQKLMLKGKDYPISKFFIKYMEDISDKHNGHVYEFYGTDEQGAVIKIDGKDGTYYIGIKYEIISVETLIYFGIAFFVLLFINAYILYYFAKSLAEDIGGVVRSLRNIAKGNNKLAHKLPITSNDEIGELEEAFNEFEEAEQREHEQLVEQERLTSLGQLVGGIAHNLRSPIMSISGAMEGLSDLVEEYEQSIENNDVTAEDYYEMGREMKGWIDKVKEYTTYMNDVITTIKDQAVSSNEDRMTDFTIEELLKRIDIITKHTLNKNHCRLNKDIKVDSSTNLIGDITVLIQVINNLITNAVDAYNGEDGDIEFKIIKEEVNKTPVFKIIVTDYAGGIKPEVAVKLFNQMYTTKSKKGTGLGLYISHTTIKGKFGGELSMDTKYGKGTTFTITLPDRRTNPEASI